MKVEGDRILLPVGSSPSTHILKFPNRDYRHLPANEVIVTRLARAVGLPVVDAEWLAIGDEGLCVVRRYDRVETDDGIVRVHQEDLCQALGIASSSKYEEEGGPSFLDAVTVVRDHAVAPLDDVDALVRWLAFGAIVGNADGHAKNLSLVRRDGLRLSPFYDLVCTRSYDALDRRLAMSIGGERDPDRLRPTHLDACARAVDVKPRLLSATFQAMAEAILDRLDDAVRAAQVGRSPAIERMTPQILEQARRWLRELRPTRR